MAVIFLLVLAVFDNAVRGLRYDANIIFIEKRWSLPCEPKKLKLFGLSFGSAMLFSRR